MQQEEISLKDLWRLIQKYFFRIVSLMIMGMILSVVFMTFFVTPKYQSSAQLMVNQHEKSIGQTSIQYSELQANSQLINTYRDIITGDSVLDQVSKDMGGNYSIGQLKEAIAVEQSPNSQAFNISVKLDSPHGAQEVLYKVISVFENTIREVYKEEKTNIFVLSPASFNPNRVSPSLPIYILIGAMIGVAVSMLMILISEISDTTVRDDDFMTQLGLTNMGQIFELSSKELKTSQATTKNLSQRKRKVV